jgi:hypothetical protein
MSVSYCMLTVVIWWCLCCYLLIIYCNKLYKSFCFWWWNRNEKQKYNTDINICTNKSAPFTHETEHARYMQSSSFGSKKLAPCKFFSWLLNWLLTFKTGIRKWHLAIFLAPTFWEPEQPLRMKCDIGQKVGKYFMRDSGKSLYVHILVINKNQWLTENITFIIERSCSK